MRRLFNWEVMLGIILIFASATVYYIHFVIFRDAHHIFLYLIGDIAFIFLEVLMVTIVLDRLLVYREKVAILKKLYMVIGTFFNQTGTELLKICSDFDPDSSKVAKRLVITGDWSGKEFSRVKSDLTGYALEIDYKRGDLDSVRDFLLSHRGFLLNLMGNPNLLEHESFTNLLWAVFHLTNELELRSDLKGSNETDLEHLAGDIKRVYRLMIFEWLDYMKHLMNDYPYLFSLAMRTNPFDPDIAVEVV